MSKSKQIVCAALAAALCCALGCAAVFAQAPGGADQEMSTQYKSSWEEFQALKAKAHAGTHKSAAQLPDWSGLWTREFIGGIKMDFRQKQIDDTTAVLTPEYQKKFDRKHADFA